jgi:electron-transferring-flavoprotein dehydrogenase
MNLIISIVNMVNKSEDSQHLSFDVVIVGGGPSGLCTAIRLAQRAKEEKSELSICVIEKGAQVGAHIISGCILNPEGLDNILPDWRNQPGPIKTRVKKDRFYWLTNSSALRLPVPPQIRNKEAYIVSLSKVCVWLGQVAEQLGVSVIPGYAAEKALFNDHGEIIGVRTGDMGRQKNGKPGPQFQPGVAIYCKQLVLAEGCKGSLTESLIDQYNLRETCQPQNYAIGLKEVWQVKNSTYDDGLSIHTTGWPLDNKTYGGGFIYHYEGKIALGIVIGLDYEVANLDAHGELQRMKTHPFIERMLDNGKCIAYGSRALNEGGFQAIPQLTLPGAMIVGCAAGFLNVAQLKGTHNAMKSGILAADAIIDTLQKKGDLGVTRCIAYQDKFEQSTMYRELKRVRNIRPGFYTGRIRGLLNAAFETATYGLAPWTLSLERDESKLKPIAGQPKQHYPKPDGKRFFSKTDSVRLTGTNHTEDQPCHLIIKDPSRVIPINYKIYGGPEQYYCPANVYEYVKTDHKLALQINAQNCIHCKTCAIKDPGNNIEWVPPQGGEGPRYSET